MLRKNTASQYIYFAMLNAADGSANTTATVTGYVAIDGAAQAAIGGTVNNKGNGQYEAALAQADTNGNNIGYLFTAPDCLAVSFSIVTTALNPYDTVRGLSGTALPNADADAAGGLPVSDAGGLDLDAILSLLDDPRGEPGQGTPPVNPDMATKMDYIFKFLRNKLTQTSTTLSIFADDGSTVDHKSTVSDDGTTYTRGEFASGP